MKILSVHYGHNATVGLMQDGKMIFCQSEERLNRLKNSTGWPDKTLKYIFETYGRDIDQVVLPNKTLSAYLFLKARGYASGRYLDYFKNTRPITLKFLLNFMAAKWWPSFFYKRLRRNSEYNQKRIEQNESLRKEAIEYFSKALQIEPEKIQFLDHHEAHALSIAYNLDATKQTLIFTLDAEGDEKCATVNIFDKNGLQTKCTIDKRNSLGYLYSEVTGQLGMKPNEDEYKVMGIAPYAKSESHAVKEVYDMFSEIVRVDNTGNFKAKFPTTDLQYFFWEKLKYARFDNVAAALQKFLEDKVTEWIRFWIKKTGITDIAVSGGVFMNVKLNQKISQMEEVKSLQIMPSAGDESLVFGCTYAGYRKSPKSEKQASDIQPIRDLYLGTKWSNKEIENILRKEKISDKYLVEYIENIEEHIAELLSKNQVVGRFADRMEWGARALGNRSLLANPGDRENIRIINEMIKNRDFWMPFTPSILNEDMEKYIINPKGVPDEFMAITFPTTGMAQKDMPAAIHPYDFTARPQRVRQNINPRYHALIGNFKAKTGIGAVLNTSFNLHGEPVVASPHDALRTLENSGLRYLALENYLISKK